MLEFVNTFFREYLVRCYNDKKVYDMNFPVDNTISIEVCRCVYRWLKRRKMYNDYYVYMSWYIVRMILGRCLYHYFNDIVNLYDVLYRDYENMMKEDPEEFIKCFDEDPKNIKKQFFKLATITESILKSCKFDDCQDIKPEYIPYTFLIEDQTNQEDQSVSVMITKAIEYLNNIRNKL